MDNNFSEKYRYIYFSYLERSNDFWGVMMAKKPKFLLFIKIILKALKTDVSDVFTSVEQIKKTNDKVWLYAESVNQYRALEPMSSFTNTTFVTRSKALSKKYKNVVYMPLKSKYKHRIIRVFKKTEMKNLFKQDYYSFYSLIFSYNGVYEATTELLAKVKPKAIIFSNDHNIFHRNLLLVANEHGIKTIYIQHATVSEKFPPLDFGLNLLEGQDALSKYKIAGTINGKVALVGMLKFDKYFKYIRKPKQTNIKVIGISLNTTDYIDKYFKLIDVIKENKLNISIIVRPHPKMNLEEKHLKRQGILLSDAKNEDSFEYLQKIDLQIAGNTSIHLESILLNIPSIQITNFSEITGDYYGFCKNNLIEIVDDVDIIDVINSYNNQVVNYRGKAKYYNALVDTEWDGNNQSYIRKTIQEYLGIEF